jgi:hypothetical protein
MARRRYPRPTVDDRVDDIRHGEPAGTKYYRVQSHELTVRAYAEWLQGGIPLEELMFTDVEFRQITGRWPNHGEEV